MYRRQLVCYLTVFTVLSLGLTLTLHSQEADKQVTIQTPVTEDLYLAGRSIHVLATVEGDVVAAGWRVAINAAVSGDVIAAAERVTVHATVGDDVRAAGREVNINGQIGDDAILAGETVTLAPETTVGGRAWLAGRRVEVAGRIGKELRAAGQSITIGGVIDGNVQLAGEMIEILPGAQIAGDLIYHSSEDALIAAGAQISGHVERIDLELPELELPEGSGFSVIIGFLLSLLLTAVVVFLLLPRLSLAATGLIRRDPFKCLGLGFTVLVVTPVLAVVLLITVLGIPLGLALLALYFVALLLGFLVGVYYLSDVGVRWWRKGAELSKSWRVLSIIVAIVVLTLLQLVPVIGGLIVLFLFLFGLGALALHVYRGDVAASVQ